MHFLSDASHLHMQRDHLPVLRQALLNNGNALYTAVHDLVVGRDLSSRILRQPYCSYGA